LLVISIIGIYQIAFIEKVLFPVEAQMEVYTDHVIINSEMHGVNKKYINTVYKIKFNSFTEKAVVWYRDGDERYREVYDMRLIDCIRLPDQTQYNFW